ncbi:membrane protein insertion efficiency factor YidD, partial [Deinococcus sp.]|uniref:membrane protein insertion efficiency factor YidD n=2 Tax=unclassified Deinococcus TaxID=2623546 RepID=UPI00391B50BF
AFPETRHVGFNVLRTVGSVFMKSGYSPSPRRLTSGMNSLNYLALGSIDLYQRWLSPLKGFRCAHAALFGGESCSAAVRRLVSEQGLLGGRGDIAARFQTCRQAYGHLAAARTAGGGVQGVCCCGPVPIPFRCG